MIENTTSKEFEERVIKLSRVSKKITGGSSLSFSALVAVGNRNGRVGIAYGKSKDASSAIAKAMNSAKKSAVLVNLKEGTIPHEIRIKYGGVRLLMKPARKGTGIIAGGAVRHIFELAGVKDISAKMLGSANKLSSLKAALKGLQSFKE